MDHPRVSARVQRHGARLTVSEVGQNETSERPDGSAIGGVADPRLTDREETGDRPDAPRHGVGAVVGLEAVPPTAVGW
jgi:hypothetical protein